MDTKAGETDGGGELLARQLRQELGGTDIRQLEEDRTGTTAGCPSVLDLACLESGDLGEFRRAAIIAHTNRCFRCGLTIAELREARNEILGATPSARSLRSQRAADAIVEILRLRLH